MIFRRNNGAADTAGLRIVISVFMVGLSFFTVWSIGVQIASFNALPFASLYPVFAAAVLTAFIGWFVDVSSIFDSPRLQMPNVSLRLPALREFNALTIVALVLLSVAFLATAAIQYKTSNFLPFWGMGIVAAIIALSRGPRGGASGFVVLSPPENKPSLMSPNQAFILIVLILLVFYYFTSVPDADDSLFLNLAIGALRNRDALFSADTMLGIGGLEFLKSTYRLESYQLLAALISDMTGMSVVLAAHAVIPGFVLVWTASVLVLIHRAAFRSYFVVTVLFHLAFLIAMDGEFLSYGYHAIPRFFQGKGPFVTTMVPLIAFLTVAALREGRWAAILLLAAAMAASMGFTANALYAAPLTAALIAIPFLFGKAEARLRPFRLLAIIIYPAILAGILLAFDPPPGVVVHGVTTTRVGPVGGILWGLLGTPYAHVLALGLIFIAALAAFAGASLRAVSVYVLALLLIALNPFLWDLFSRSVTGGNNYRLLWAVPLPFLLAMSAGVLWATKTIVIRAVVLIGLAVAVVAPGSIFYKATPGFAPIKIPVPQYAIAKTVNGIAGRDDVILAPEEISAWIPTLNDARPVVEGRALYLAQRSEQFSPERLGQRSALYLYWDSNTALNQVDGFGALLDTFSVSVIVLDTERVNHVAALENIVSLGFSEQAVLGKYKVLTR